MPMLMIRSDLLCGFTLAGDLIIDATLTTDPNGGVPPLGERLEAWDALAGARLDAVAAEARCKAARARAGQVKGEPGAPPPRECRHPRITSFPEDQQPLPPPQAAPCSVPPLGYFVSWLYQSTYCDQQAAPRPFDGGGGGGYGGGYEGGYDEYYGGGYDYGRRWRLA
ncbi:MAG: hypothetical protein J3K34DRAFT_466531 [Monoraphidium minutum]|nr:MAG: hypothetical protein J3K34DRAFT_466531 [Monoraphidium minutum]